MGIYFISGLGRSPGAVTIPPIHMYFILGGMNENDTACINFYRFSGEIDQEKKGGIESIFFLSSPEIIGGRIPLFNFKADPAWEFTHLKPNTEYTAGKFFDKFFVDLKKILKKVYSDNSALIEYLNNPKHYPPSVYFVKVDYRSFEDSFATSLKLLYGLRHKETWCCLTGGGNQINMSLLMSAGLTSNIGREFYYYGTDISCIHPPRAPRDYRIPKEVPPAGWYGVPALLLFYDRLMSFLERSVFNSKIFFDKFVEMLRDEFGDRKYPNSLPSKLLNSGIIKITDDGYVEKGKVYRFIEKIEMEYRRIDNFTDLKKKLGEEGRLYVLEDGKIVGVN